jgi:hypothetical protein
VSGTIRPAWIFDFVCYTPAELDTMRESPFLRRVFSERVLFEAGPDRGGPTLARAGARGSPPGGGLGRARGLPRRLLPRQAGRGEGVEGGPLCGGGGVGARPFHRAAVARGEPLRSRPSAARAPLVDPRRLLRLRAVSKPSPRASPRACSREKRPETPWAWPERSSPTPGNDSRAVFGVKARARSEGGPG